MWLIFTSRAHQSQQKAAPEAATRCYESALEKIDDLLKINTQDAHFKLSQEKRDTVSAA